MRFLVVNFILRLVSFSRHVLFHSLAVYSRDGKNELILSFPSVVFANHVSEFDIPVMTYLARHLKGDPNFTVPAREDILQPGFLINEFPSTGILRIILKFIDWTGIIPFLFTFINAIPVKRPFRDNARKLAKSGELRDIVDQNWDRIAEKILSEKLNVFIFPEGTYTFDGYVNSFRRGLILLKEKVPHLRFSYVTLTYDHLSYEKVDVHVVIGELQDFPKSKKEEEISSFAKDLIGKNFVINHGNLLSFAILQKELQQGIEYKQYLAKWENFVSRVKFHPEFVLSKRFSTKDHAKITQRILQKAIQSGFLRLENGILYGEEKLFQKPDAKNWKFLKSNPYLYHKNQLQYYLTELEKIWKSIG